MSLLLSDNQKRITLLGINSGTSADSVDLTAVRVDRTSVRPSVELVDATEVKYPTALRTSVLEAADARRVEPELLMKLDLLLGQFFGRKAADWLRKLKRQKITVDLIGSHGQTIRHRPGLVGRYSATLQLGLPEMIAEATSLPVVADFRQADIALGSEGAPITTGAMQRIFADTDDVRLIVNIGGMANYFLIPPISSSLPPEAADCGPGNILLDLAADTLLGKPFDRSGKMAASGKIDTRKLGRLKKIISSESATSTGRETYTPDLAKRMIGGVAKESAGAADVMKSLAEATVFGIVRKVRPLLALHPSLTELYLTGGGRRNKFLMTRLQQELPTLAVRPIESLGWPSGAVEAGAYAVMAEAFIRKESLRGMQPNRKTARPLLGRLVLPPAERND
jgi:anhydro-N-acetylmuramic acid kinase